VLFDVYEEIGVAALLTASVATPVLKRGGEFGATEASFPAPLVTLEVEAPSSFNASLFYVSGRNAAFCAMLHRVHEFINLSQQLFGAEVAF
jgi:hypothetical protein